MNQTQNRPTAPAEPSARLAQRAGFVVRMLLAAIAVLWVALCVAVGPLYWCDGSIADWSWANTLYFLLAAVAMSALIYSFVSWGKNSAAGTKSKLHIRCARFFRNLVQRIPQRFPKRFTQRFTQRIPASTRTAIRENFRRFFRKLGRAIQACTNSPTKLFVCYLIIWLWVPATLVSAFGADIFSQAREFSWAWNQFTGLKQQYIGFFSFVPMDIYPTAHYLWPEHPVYLTDQHNIILTLLYGGVLTFSRYISGSNDLGFVFLSVLQYVFAAFCCAATTHRVCNVPAPGSPISDTRWHPARVDYTTNTLIQSPAHGEHNHTPLYLESSSSPVRFSVLAWFALCPLAVFSTVSLTKSPLFAFAFVWWLGIFMQLHLYPKHKVSWKIYAALALSSTVMLASAKYAWYLIVAQALILIISQRRRWWLFAVSLLIPTLIIHGGVSFAIDRGVIISGDPIESRGIQLQQIARIAKKDPQSISEEAQKLIAPIFNLDQMAKAYYANDADPVKSSGIQSKRVSYKWRTVTESDMQEFNAAWKAIVQESPVVALDAFLAKVYGYFNVVDHPYVAMDYYVDSRYVTSQTDWIGYYNAAWREHVTTVTRAVSNVPVLGWPLHGNFYVTLTLALGAAEILLKRYRTIAWQMPLVLLMGVMISAPANNFERHMLPVAFSFAAVCIMFARDNWRERERQQAIANSDLR